MRHARLITGRRRLWRYGDVARYHCSGGTTGRGDEWKRCGEGGVWSGGEFECVGEYIKADFYGRTSFIL